MLFKIIIFILIKLLLINRYLHFEYLTRYMLQLLNEAVINCYTDLFLGHFVLIKTFLTLFPYICFSINKYTE